MDDDDNPHANDKHVTHNEAQNAIGYITTALHHFQAQIVAKEEKIALLYSEISGVKETEKQLGLAVQMKEEKIASLYSEISGDKETVKQLGLAVQEKEELIASLYREISGDKEMVKKLGLGVQELHM